VAQEQNELEGVPEPGEIVVGKYRVDRVLGVGGMGCVVAATHTTLDQKVAIKFLLVKAAKNPKNVMRFQREAQAAAKIKSDHVAKVSDVGTLDNGTPFMVMEYLDGEDLSERLQNKGPLQPDEAVRYLMQACEALAEAHRNGIIHRDLKPANLFVATAADGNVRVKVLDFGISKIIDEKDDLTKTSALMGSPLYMSPEQMMSAKAADARADIWALGCILFELVSGQPPFIGNTLPEICSRILTAPPTQLSSLIPIQPELEAVIMHALQKKPEERFQSLAEFASAIYRFGGELAARSASIVCRVLDAPHLSPPSTELPTSMGDLSGQHQRQSYGQALQHVSGQQPQVAPHTPLPHSPQVGQQGHPQQQGYPQQHGQVTGPQMPSYPQGASTSQNQYAPIIATHTSPSPGTLPGMPHAGVAPIGMPAGVMASGASTAAPVAQTMSEEYSRKSRAPLFIGLGGLVVAAAIGAVVVFGISGDAPSAKAGDTTTSPAASPEPEQSADAKSQVVEDTPDPEPSADIPTPLDKPDPGTISKPQIPRPGTLPKPAAPKPEVKPPPAPPPAPAPPVPQPPRGNHKDGDGSF
jgi:serine/threonine-protein kinase